MRNEVEKTCRDCGSRGKLKWYENELSCPKCIKELKQARKEQINEVTPAPMPDY
jgi:Zn finger protein HypA/HybF involved in hydrogenase expression